jgi:hypothetical protein
MKVFEPLPAGQFIRLIELHSGDRQSPLVATFRVVELLAAPDYDALSYVWGDPGNKGFITCNGQTFSITANLLLALQRLRQNSHIFFVWTDAICIDQSNDQERSQQVSMMGLIYARAKTVFVHIPGSKRTPREHLNVQELVEDIKGRVVVSGGWSKTSKTENSRLKHDDPFINDLRWKAMSTFLTEDWFNRAWVLQEVAMARDPYVLYGDCGFSYRDLILLCRWVGLCGAQIHGKWKLKVESSHLAALDWYREDRTDSPAYPVVSFLDMFNVASYHLCKDPRDHIYSLLHHPLAKHADGSLLVQPDYSKPVEQIYYELACQMLRQPEGLRLLGTVDNGDDDPPTTLPSWVPWVPRWKDPMRARDACFAVGVCPLHPFNSSVGLGPVFHRIRDDRALLLRGIYFDRIRSVFTITTQKNDFGPNLSREFVKMYSEITALESPYGSAEDRLDAFSITLTTGFLSRQGGVGLDELKVHRANFDAFWEAGTNETLYPDNDIVGNAQSFIADLLQRFPNGSVFITRKGYIGYGGAYARRDDHCVIFQGGFSPFIVRRHEGNGTLRLVSECYVHGIMKGEVAPMVHAKKFEMEEVVLS